MLHFILLIKVSLDIVTILFKVVVILKVVHILGFLAEATILGQFDLLVKLQSLGCVNIIGPSAISQESILSVGQLYLYFRVFHKLRQYYPKIEVVYRVIRVVPRVLVEVFQKVGQVMGQAPSQEGEKVIYISYMVDQRWILRMLLLQV